MKFPETSGQSVSEFRHSLTDCRKNPRDLATETQQDGGAVERLVGGQSLGRSPRLTDDNRLETRIDDPYGLASGPQPLADFLVHLSRRFTGRDDFDREIGGSRPESLGWSIRWNPVG